MPRGAAPSASNASGKYLGTDDEKAEHQKAENAEKH
jgi:hypothetical protein